MTKPRSIARINPKPFAMARLAGHTLAGQCLLAQNRMDDAKDEFNAAERESEALAPRVAAALPYPTVSSRPDSSPGKSYPGG